MAMRSDTTTQHTFHRTTNPQDVNSQAFFLFGGDSSRPEVTSITLPRNSTWSPGPHWHEKHTEYFKVVKGQVSLKLDGVSTVIGPRDGMQRVDKFVVHDFCRADKDLPENEKDTEEVITEEWTDPADGIKHVFFRNVFSVLQDSEKYWGRWTLLQALLVAASYDDFIEVLPGRFSYFATHTLYSSMRILGRLIGLRTWYEEYTPVELRAVARGDADLKRE